MHDELANLTDHAVELTADHPKLLEYALRARDLLRRRRPLEAVKELWKVQRRFPQQLYRLGQVEHGLNVEAYWR